MNQIITTTNNNTHICQTPISTHPPETVKQIRQTHRGGGAVHCFYLQRCPGPGVAFTQGRILLPQVQVRILQEFPRQHFSLLKAIFYCLRSKAKQSSDSGRRKIFTWGRKILPWVQGKAKLRFRAAEKYLPGAIKYCPGAEKYCPGSKAKQSSDSGRRENIYLRQ